MLTVTVRRESEHLARETRRFRNVLGFVVIAVGGLMSLGAVLAALSTMNSFVSDRATEMAVLMALGFNRLSILASVIFESLLLSGCGACIGAVAVWLLFDGATLSTIAGSAGNAQLVFAMTITPSLIGIGVVAALLLGLLGGAWPAIRAAHTPIVEGLRAY
jgi:putative ABC transport system permease protein